MTSAIVRGGVPDASASAPAASSAPTRAMHDARPNIRPRAARRVPFDLIAISPCRGFDPGMVAPRPSQVPSRDKRSGFDSPVLPSQAATMTDLLIIGPQRRAPQLSSRLAAAGMRGPIAAITAGWQGGEAAPAALAARRAQPVTG